MLPEMSSQRFRGGLLVTILAIMATLLVGQLKYTFLIEYGVEVLNISGSSFHYNLWGSLSKLWEEKLFFLYTFLFCFSGIWPFVKVFLMGVLLGFNFSLNSKLKFLNWIASVGIWSFADVWVVVMISIVLNDNKTVQITEDTSVTAKLQVTPLDGVIVLFCGLFFSQLVNVVAVHWLKSNALSSSEGEYCQIDMDDDCASDSSAGSDSKSTCCDSFGFLTNKKLWVKFMAEIIYVALLLFFLFGMIYTPLYEIKYVVIKKYTSVSQYSIVSGIMHLLKVLHESDDNNTSGQYFLFVISIIFVVVFPLLQQLIMAMLWFLPKFSFTSSLMPVKRIQKFDMILEFISHFASLEVFLVSSLFVAYELGSLLSNLALGKYLSIDISILPMFFVYFVGVVILSIIKYEICHSYQSKLASSMNSNTSALAGFRPLMAEYGRESIVL